MDDCPGDKFLCPGCGLDVTGWMSHDAHYRAGSERHGAPKPSNWPWTDRRGRVSRAAPLCEWTRDHLSAEWLRRHPQPWVYT